MTYCRSPFVCFGLYCDVDQTINENGDCVSNNRTTPIPIDNISTYIYFKESYGNSTRNTNLQTYYKKLKSKKVPLKTTQPFSMYYMMTYLYFTVYNYEMKSQRSDSIPFIAVKTDQHLYLIDFECSLQDAVNKLVKILNDSMESYPSLNHILDASSIVCQLLIIFFYLMLKDLRRTVVGKSILIYCFLATFNNVQEMVSMEIYVNHIFLKFNRYIYYMSKMWINIICFETFYIMR
jgi:hypothetical protein